MCSSAILLQSPLDLKFPCGIFGLRRHEAGHLPQDLAPDLCSCRAFPAANPKFFSLLLSHSSAALSTWLDLRGLELLDPDIPVHIQSRIRAPIIIRVVDMRNTRLIRIRSLPPRSLQDLPGVEGQGSL